MIAAARMMRATLFLAAIALSTAVSAHGGTGLAGGLQSGILHPLTGLDHLLAMLAVGLWGAVLGKPLVYVLPVLFPILMVVGAVLGMAEVLLPMPQTAIALSVVTLGSCIGLAARPPVVLATAIVASFAIYHGYSHGRELPSALDPVGYSMGFTLATGFLHVCGIALGEMRAWPYGTAAVRITGAAITLAGIGFLLR